MNEEVKSILKELLKVAKLSGDPEVSEQVSVLEQRIKDLGVDLEDPKSGAW